MTTAIILAGGLGTRLRSAVPNLAKPMAPVNGRPFLEYQMDYWIRQGVSRFVLSVGYRKDDIVQHFGSSYKGCGIEYAVEDQPLGTGGGFIKAIQLIDQIEPILVLNGDTFFEVNYDELISYHRHKKSDWTFSLFRTAEVDRYTAVNVGPAGEIISFKSEINMEKHFANGGVYLVNPQVVNLIKLRPGDKASLEDDIFLNLMAQNISFFGMEFAGRFIDIGLPIDYKRAADLLIL